MCWDPVCTVAEVWCCSEHYLWLFGGGLYLDPFTAVYCCRAVVSEVDKTTLVDARDVLPTQHVSVWPPGNETQQSTVFVVRSETAGTNPTDSTLNFNSLWVICGLLDISAVAFMYKNINVRLSQCLCLVLFVWPFFHTVQMLYECGHFSTIDMFANLKLRWNSTEKFTAACYWLWSFCVWPEGLLVSGRKEPGTTVWLFVVFVVLSSGFTRQDESPRSNLPATRLNIKLAAIRSTWQSEDRRNEPEESLRPFAASQCRSHDHLNSWAACLSPRAPCHNNLN